MHSARSRDVRRSVTFAWRHGRCASTDLEDVRGAVTHVLVVDAPAQAWPPPARGTRRRAVAGSRRSTRPGAAHPPARRRAPAHPPFARRIRHRPSGCTTSSSATASAPFPRAADGSFPTEGAMFGQAHHRVGEQRSIRPAPRERSTPSRPGTPPRSRRASLRAGARCLAERLLEALLSEAPLGAVDGRSSYRNVPGDRAVPRPTGGREQDLGSAELPNRAPAAQDQDPEAALVPPTSA